MKTVLSILMLGCTSLSYCQSAPANTKPFVLGVIDQIQSVELSETRILNIYLPEGYKPDDGIQYPVVYLLDGSADEDFIHITGLYQFNTFEWVNRVPKSIIVGIASVDRRRDFTFPTTIAKDLKDYPTTGHSDKFIAFIENELQPYIQKKYNTSASKTIIGQSLGGLLATEILFKHPGLFTQYIIVSPSLWWDNDSLLAFDATKAISGVAATKIYIGVGKEGPAMETDAKKLADKITAVKNSRVKVYFEYLPLENHATILHQAVSNALIILDANKKEEK